MMQNYNIREAEFNDSSPILKLIKELAEYENEPNAVNLLVEDIQLGMDKHFILRT